MDPNTTLAELRKAVASALEIGYQAQLKESVAQLNTRLMQMAQAFDNLDGWLSRGGFPPEAWQSNPQTAWQKAARDLGGGIQK